MIEILRRFGGGRFNQTGRFFRGAIDNRHAVTRNALILLALFFGQAAWNGRAQAGLSSENIVVVVNADSAVSRTIANHYIDLRQIPSQNVVMLSDVPTGIQVELEPFREKILKPLLIQLDKRDIADRVRVVAYSADFPTAVRVTEHREKITDPGTKKYQGPMASITGLTFFYRLVLADSPNYLSLLSNFYARGKFGRHFLNPFGGETKGTFEEAVKLMKEEKFEESAEIWKGLLEKNPMMPALAIRAAEAYSAAEKNEEAVKMIEAAIRAGWWSARYLRETPSLDRHLEEPSLAQALKFLDDSPIDWQGPEAFSARVGWALSGSRVSPKQGGIPYLCSCLLAVTHPNGLSIQRSVDVLRRSSRADRTFPDGKVMFSSTGDVRSKTRTSGFPAAMVYLNENGFSSRICSTTVPDEEMNIIGLMTGSASVKLTGNPWIFVPGAIAENLTSFGGAYGIKGHTKITEFLRAGAAMSSGAVAEPYALPTKFPNAMLYAYYAKGMSAIEAFYLSVQSPYQLLIVGDPMTQPFARAPAEVMDFKLISDGKKLINLTRRSLGIDVPKSETRSIEIYVNDRLFKITPPAPSIDINWPEDLSGIYDVRATLSGVDRTEPRITFLAELDVEGPHEPPTATLVEPRSDADGDAGDGTKATASKWELSCPDAEKIELMHLGQVVATVTGEKGTVTVETNQLGGGPLRFRPLATFPNEVKRVQGRVVID